MTLHFCARNWFIEKSNSLGYKYEIALLFFQSVPLTVESLF